MQITPEHFETYRALILSGQIEQQDVPKLLEENPAFAMWYRIKDRTDNVCCDDSSKIDGAT